MAGARSLMHHHWELWLIDLARRGGLAEGTFGIRSDTLALDERLADCCFGYSLGYFWFV